MTSLSKPSPQRTTEIMFQLQEEFARKSTLIGLNAKVLDHGSVELLDFMGNDQAICEAAWVSTESSTQKRSPVPQFIDYLKRHKHTSPFEMAVLKFKVRAPLFVVQQWIRHRTGSFNQESGRYVELSDEFYFPQSQWREGGTGHNGNKQGSVSLLDADSQLSADIIYEHLEHQVRGAYKQLLALGVAPELARLVVTTSQYTEFIWKVDLHNLMHFLALRTDHHAQQEIQDYANVVLAITQQVFPEAMTAWENHHKYAVTFSLDEQEVLRLLINAARNGDETEEHPASVEDYLRSMVAAYSGLRQSRQMELLAKLQRILDK